MRQDEVVLSMGTVAQKGDARSIASSDIMARTVPERLREVARSGSIS